MEDKIKEVRYDLKNPHLSDHVVTVTTIEDIRDYVNLLPSAKRNLLRHCFISGYEKGSTNVAFPHIVPDNCADIAGLLLENLLKNKNANRSIMNEYKKHVISYIIANQNN